MKRLLTTFVFVCAIAAQNPQTPKWASPSWVAVTDADWGVETNLIGVPPGLSGAILAGDTSLTLSSATGWLAPVWIQIDSELIHCTTLSVATLSGCTRAAEGSTAASHANGATVHRPPLAQSFNQIKAEVKSLEANAKIAYATPSSPTFNAGGTTTCNWTTSNVCAFTMTGNTTLALSNPRGVGPFVCVFTQDATGSRIVTLPASIKNPPDIAPAPNAVTIFTLVYDGSTNYTAQSASSADTWHGLSSPESGAPAGVAGEDLLYADSATHRWKMNNNNGGAQTVAAKEEITDVNLLTTDITTGNASTSKHGLLPKLDNVVTHYLDGTGAYSTPPGGGGGGLTTAWVLAFNTAAYSNITGSQYNLITFDTNDANISPSSMHSTSSNTSRFVAPVTGYYTGYCIVSVQQNQATLALQIRLNAAGSSSGGAAVANVAPNTGTGSFLRSQITWTYHLALNDYVECFAYPGGTNPPANGAAETQAAMWRIF